MMAPGRTAVGRSRNESLECSVAHLSIASDRHRTRFLYWLSRPIGETMMRPENMRQGPNDRCSHPILTDTRIQVSLANVLGADGATDVTTAWPD